MNLLYCFKDGEALNGLFVIAKGLEQGNPDWFLMQIEHHFNCTILKSWKGEKNGAVAYKMQCADNTKLELVEFDIYCITAIEDLNTMIEE